MIASRKRRILIIGVLGALFALGGGCLAYLATASSSGTSAVGSSAGRPSDIATSDGTGPDTAGASGGGSSGGGEDETAPPKPGRSLSVSGPDLDGSGGRDCVQVIKSNAQVPVRVTSVRVTGTDVAADSAECPSGNGPRCAGARLAPGEACRVAVRLTADKPTDYYPVTVTLTMGATCTDTRRTPCDEAKVAALAPSAARPVFINWTASLSDDAFLDGSDETESPSVDEGSTPSTESTPDVEDTPDGAAASEASS